MKVTIEVDQADQVLLLFPIFAAIQREGTILSSTVVETLERCKDSIVSRISELKTQVTEDQKVETEKTAEPAAEEKPKRAAKKKAEIPADVKATAPSLDDIRKALGDVPGAREKAKEYLKKVGKEKISDLDDSGRADFMVELGLSAA